MQPQGGAGAGHLPADARASRRDDRELRAGRRRAARLRLRDGPRDQPPDHLCPGQGLRPRWAVRRLPELRHDRSGGRRGAEHHGRERASADSARADYRRHRDWTALRDRHPRSPLPAGADRARPADRGRDAGSGGQLLPDLLRPPGPFWPSGGSSGQQQRPGLQRSQRRLPVQGRWAKRLLLYLHLARYQHSLAAAAEGDRPRRPARRPALLLARGAHAPRGRGERAGRGLDARADQAGGDGDAGPSRGAGRGGVRHQGAVRRPAPAQAGHLRDRPAPRPRVGPDARLASQDVGFGGRGHERAAARPAQPGGLRRVAGLHAVRGDCPTARRSSPGRSACRAWRRCST